MRGGRTAAGGARGGSVACSLDRVRDGAVTCAFTSKPKRWREYGAALLLLLLLPLSSGPSAEAGRAAALAGSLAACRVACALVRPVTRWVNFLGSAVMRGSQYTLRVALVSAAAGMVNSGYAET